MVEKIIFDCDNTMGLPFKEVDDGLVLLYLLGQPGVELLGITTTFGNGSIKQVVRQTRQLMDRLDLHIPCFEGESSPSGETDTPAAEFLVEQASRNPGQVTILATGPLGNIAAASQIDPHFFANLKRIVCMGGYIEPLRIGWRNLKELNFSANPQAIYTVLNAECPVTVMNGHICTQAYLRRQDIERLTFWPKSFGSMLTRWLITFGIFCGVDVFYLWDLLPAVYLNHPELFEPSMFNCSSNIDDLRTGMLIKGKDPLAKQIEMPLNIVDPDKFYKIVTKSWEEAAELYPMRS